MESKTNGKKLYDDECKKVLSQKEILAWIMKGFVHEYKNSSIQDIKNKYIEGSPLINSYILDTDDKYYNKEIMGMNTESKSINDGTIYFDIKYKSLLPEDKSSAYLIINIEAQNERNVEYDITKRAIYYISRLISEQKNKEFTGSNYSDIKKVYSIWIFTSANNKETMTVEYRLSRSEVVGSYEDSRENKDYDIMDIVMIYLGKKGVLDNKVDEDKKNAIDLLDLLFIKNESSDKKIDILANRFGIKVGEDLKMEVKQMCNLSQGIEDRGIAIGLKQGISQGIEQGIEQGKKQGISIGRSEGISIGENKKKIQIIKNMLKNGIDTNTISLCTEMSVDEIKNIIEDINSKNDK